MFSASQEKIEKGLKFQYDMLEIFRNHFSNVVDSREFIMKLKPNEADVVYNMFESKNGDILIEDIHLECVTVASESIFPENKINNFKGKNHYYIFHLDDIKEIYIVHSNIWNSYIRKCKKINKSGRCYRSFKSKYILNLRKKILLSDFIDQMKLNNI